MTFARYAYYDGLYGRLDEISIGSTDLSVHRGYSIFEFFRYTSPDDPYLQWYLDRFYQGAEHIGLTVEYSRAEIISICQHLAETNRLNPCYIKLILSAGPSTNGFDPSGKSVLLAAAMPIKHRDEKLYENGSKLISAHYSRDMPLVKTTNYLYAASRATKMRAEGAVEILFHDQLGVTECSRSNVFWVKNGQLHTTKDRILEGITRKKVMSLADVKETSISLDELRRADEVFITSTTKGVLPIVQIDDGAIGDGQVGMVTSELMRVSIFIH